MSEKERFVYIPRIKSHGCLYEGKPLVQRIVRNKIGEEGVKELDDFIKKIVEKKNKVIGESTPGLAEGFLVADFKHRLLLLVGDGIAPFEGIMNPYYDGQPTDNCYSVVNAVHGHKADILTEEDETFKKWIDRLLNNQEYALLDLTEKERKEYNLKNKCKKN